MRILPATSTFAFNSRAIVLSSLLITTKCTDLMRPSVVKTSP